MLAAKVCTSLAASSCRTAADTVLRLKAGGRCRCRKSSTGNRCAVAPRRKCSGTSNPSADRTAEEDTKERNGNCCWTKCRKSAGCMDRVVERTSRREAVGMCLSSVCRSRMMSLASSALNTQTQ